MAHPSAHRMIEHTEWQFLTDSNRYLMILTNIEKILLASPYTIFSIFNFQAGHLFGSILSPIANKHLGPYGCYSLGIVLYLLVLIYLIFVVKPVTKPATTSIHRVSMIVTDCSHQDEEGSTVTKTENDSCSVEENCEENNTR